MPRDIVAERKHRHELRRAAVRKTKAAPTHSARMKDRRLVWANPYHAENVKWQPDRVSPPGPKKYKWKRDEKSRSKWSA